VIMNRSLVCIIVLIAACGVYAQDPALEGYDFFQGMDIWYNDIKFMEGATVSELQDACNADSACLAFTTRGFLKMAVPAQSEWHHFSDDALEGTYVKQDATIEGYNFFQGMDIWYEDIKFMEDATVAELKTACDADDSCVAFTTRGFLKNIVPDQSKWHYFSADPLEGTYVKQTSEATQHHEEVQQSSGTESTEVKQTAEATQHHEKVKLPSGTCWLDSYGRGVGRPIHTCPDGQDKDGALCYPQCNPGDYGVGPVCWNNCPGNFRDDGAFCAKPAPYGRGAGYVIWQENKCNQNSPIFRCEKYGAMWYSRCAPNFHNVGCCICSPDCPAGMTDIGVSCAKHSYGRGAGNVLQCASNEDSNAGLCYDYCREGYKGIGPVCWNSCPAGLDACGAMCVPSGQCAGKILSIASSTIEGSAQVATGVASVVDGDITGVVGTVGGVNKMLGGFNYPICGQSSGILDEATEVIGTIHKVGETTSDVIGKIGDVADAVDGIVGVGEIDDVAEIVNLA